MSKYRKQFLDLALQTGIIHWWGENQRLHIDPFFQGNAHAVNLAARACREAMNNPAHLDICNSGVLMSFDGQTYPLLPVAAQAFRGGDCKGFVHSATEHLTKLGERPNGDKFVLLGTNENETALHGGAIQHINDTLGTCVGVVMLYSPAFIQGQNNKILASYGIPIIRVILEQEATTYLEANMDAAGVFTPPKPRQRQLD